MISSSVVETKLATTENTKYVRRAISVIYSVLCGSMRCSNVSLHSGYRFSDAVLKYSYTRKKLRNQIGIVCTPVRRTQRCPVLPSRIIKASKSRHRIRVSNGLGRKASSQVQEHSAAPIHISAQLK